MNEVLIAIVVVLGLCALIALTAVLAALFVCVAGSTIVYSWWRRLQVTGDQLPEMLQERLYELVAQQMQPYREYLDNKTGRAEALPTKLTAPDEVDLDEEFSTWLNKS